MSPNRNSDPERTVTRFGLMRHAQTLWNREKRIQGQHDSPLTPRGSREAEQWGKRIRGLAWDRILTSDTGRARQTARRVNQSLNLPMTTDPRLREQDWGAWTGLTVGEVEALYAGPAGRATGSGWQFCPPQGESRTDMWLRGSGALLDAAGRWPGQSLLVVTHEGMIRCVLNRLLGQRFLATEPKVMRPAHLHVAACQNGRLTLETINAVDLTAPAP